MQLEDETRSENPLSALLRLASMAAAFLIVAALLVYAAQDALGPANDPTTNRGGTSGSLAATRAGHNPRSVGVMSERARPATVVFLICDGEGISRTVYNGSSYDPDISFSLPADRELIAALLRGETAISKDAEVVESACFRDVRLSGRIPSFPD
jgi:hypothetical protein